MTKVDIVGREAALAHEKQIREFVKGSIIEDAPIVPVMPNLGINVNVILEMIAKMPKPQRDLTSDPLMYIVRSFDINKPGIDATKIVGGVLGGAVIKGRFRAGDEVEIRPGIKTGAKAKKDVYEKVVTVINGLSNGSDHLEEALPGGLVGVSTELDPMFTKADGLVGSLVGHLDKLPPVISEMKINYYKLDRNDIPKQQFVADEALILGAGTTTVLGYVKTIKKDVLGIELKHPVCIDKGAKIAVMRTIARRWKLTGYGMLA